MRIVAFAYACEPDKGSEPEAGWMWARMLSRLGETWVITRRNNAELIQQTLPKIPEYGALHFVYVDPPSWLTFWKRGQRGVRTFYLLWQIAAWRRAKQLHNEISFDVAWHLTLANAWLGSTASLLPARFVYGPVGGGVRPPWRLVLRLGFRGVVYEAARGVGRLFGRYLNPLARMAWRRADLILAQNGDTARWFPRRHRSKVTVFSNAVLAPEEIVAPDRKAVPVAKALFAARLTPLKGASLALRTLAKGPRDLRLLICGNGRERRRLQRLAHRLQVSDRVFFLGQVDRGRLSGLMRDEASFLLFPSLHDEAGRAVLEALALGRTVVCLDRGGPAELVGEAGRVISSAGGIEEVTSRLAEALCTPALAPALAVQRARVFVLEERARVLESLITHASLEVELGSNP